MRVRKECLYRWGITPGRPTINKSSASRVNHTKNRLSTMQAVGKRDTCPNSLFSLLSKYPHQCHQCQYFVT